MDDLGFNTIRDAMPTSEQAAAHLSAVVKPLGFSAPTEPLRLSGTLTGPWSEENHSQLMAALGLPSVEEAAALPCRAYGACEATTRAECTCEEEGDRG